MKNYWAGMQKLQPLFYVLERHQSFPGKVVLCCSIREGQRKKAINGQWSRSIFNNLGWLFWRKNQQWGRELITTNKRKWLKEDKEKDSIIFSISQPLNRLSRKTDLSCCVFRNSQKPQVWYHCQLSKLVLLVCVVALAGYRPLPKLDTDTVDQTGINPSPSAALSAVFIGSSVNPQLYL